VKSFIISGLAGWDWHRADNSALVHDAEMELTSLDVTVDRNPRSLSTNGKGCPSNSYIAVAVAVAVAVTTASEHGLIAGCHLS